MGSPMTADEFLASLPAPIDLENGRDESGARYFTVSDVRKRVRSELALGVERGAFPADTKFSVTGDHNSITTEIVAWQGAVFTDSYVECLLDKGDPTRTPREWREWHEPSRRFVDSRIVPALRDALWLADRITNRHNYDRSDIQSDYFNVGYYDHVQATTVLCLAERAIQLESDPAFADLHRRALIAAACVGERCVDATVGKRGFDTAGEYALNTLIKRAQRADGYPLAYDKRARSWRPDKTQPKGLTYEQRLASEQGRAQPEADSSCKTDHESEDCEECGTTPIAPSKPQCPHNHTQDGGRMYVDPTVFCLLCGASRKMASTRWSDGAAA